MPSIRFLTLLGAACAAVALLAAPAQARPASAFYYPWWGTAHADGAFAHWSQEGRLAPFDIASNFFPARGVYSSSDRKVVAEHMKQFAAAGVNEAITSWWGWGSPEDRRLPMILRAAHKRGISVSVHLEPYPGRTIESVQADILHLRTLGITRVFVYRPFDLPPAAWASLRSLPLGVTLFAQTTLVGRAAAAGFDGVYTYDVLLFGANLFPRFCTQARGAGLLCAPSVGPGYDASRATGDPRTKSRRDGKTYDAMWKAAIAADADEVTITSFNEWHEGTQIEPARSVPQRLASVAKYASYDGAYGLRGKAAEGAYLTRTAYWTKRFGELATRRKPRSVD